MDAELAERILRKSLQKRSKLTPALCRSIVEAWLNGASQKSNAKQHGVGTATVTNVLRKAKEAKEVLSQEE